MCAVGIFRRVTKTTSLNHYCGSYLGCRCSTGCRIVLHNRVCSQFVAITPLFFVVAILVVVVVVIGLRCVASRELHCAVWFNDCVRTRSSTCQTKRTTIASSGLKLKKNSIESRGPAVTRTHSHTPAHTHNRMTMINWRATQRLACSSCAQFFPACDGVSRRNSAVDIAFQAHFSFRFIIFNLPTKVLYTNGRISPCVPSSVWRYGWLEWGATNLNFRRVWLPYILACKRNFCFITLPIRVKYNNIRNYIHRRRLKFDVYYILIGVYLHVCVWAFVYTYLQCELRHFCLLILWIYWWIFKQIFVRTECNKNQINGKYLINVATAKIHELLTNLL